MNWKIETFEEYRTRVSRFSKWFAWYPIIVDGRCYWLEMVLKRYKFSYSSYDGFEKEAIYKPLDIKELN